MKSRLLFLTFIIFGLGIASSNAQIMTSDPAIPMVDEAITVFFDATLGNAGLKDYSGDIYAHTGVITDKSTGTSDWKYVKTAWGENTAETKLTKVSSNLYSLEFSPSIRDYYGVSEGEKITHLAFVFRSHDNTKEGKDDDGSDIFMEVDDGLNITMITPDKTWIINQGTVVNFEAATSEAATMTLYKNDELINTVTATSITHDFTFNLPGDFWLKILASTAEENDSDSVFVHVLETLTNEALPENTEYGINYISSESVRLVLHAPGKEHVFVVGDFNAWTPSANYRMKKDIDVYWLEVSDLVPGKEYAFQYLVDGEILIADPYTDKVLDPNNDKWISNNTYPDLISYPSGVTSGITSVLQTDQTPYEWNNIDFIAPEKENLVVYELLLRDFIAAHDWTTLIDSLDYFSRLGINAIELMPFSEFEGNESWGYNPSFYFATDKYYGPKNDLKAFIDACHGRGIAVIMDLVLNHSFSQSPLVQLYYNDNTDKVTAENPWYNVDSPNTSYSWGYDFNHESQDTKNFIDRVNSYWLDEYKIDGFRFDFTKGFTNTSGDGWAYDAARIAILKRMADQIWNTNTNAYVIFEHLSDNSEEIVLANYGIMLWGNMNFSYNEATMGWHESNKSDFSNISYKKRAWNDPMLVGYMESHDEERLMFKNLEYGNASDSYSIKNLNTALARMELAGAFFFTIPGPKMIWQFGELGYDFSIDENGRVGNKPIRWDYYDVGKRRKIYQIYSALIKLKTSEPAFNTDDYSLYLSYNTKRIELNHEDMDVRIIGNFDVSEQTIDPSFSNIGSWYNFFTGETLNVTDTHKLITLAPGEYHIYTNKKLDTPKITANIYSSSYHNSIVNIFPNPASEIIHVNSEKEITKVSILDLKGRIIHSEQSSSNTSTLNTAHLNPGIYVLQIELNNQLTSFKRFIKN